MNQNKPDLNQIAITSVKDLLEEENITKIYYIDDKFNDEELKETFMGRMKQIKSTDKYPENIEIFEGINWNAPLAIFESELNKKWNKEDPKQLIHEICNFIGDDSSSNVIPALEIEQHFGSIVKILTPNEWQKQRSSILGSLNSSSKGLFLFDFELDNWRGENGEKNGIELAKQIIENTKEENIYCGIFSHVFSIEDEDKFRIEYSEIYEIEKRSFYTISKKRYAYDPKLSAFAEGIKNVISLRYIEKLKDASNTILRESMEASLNELDKLSPKTFNQIIQKSAKKEGAWEVKQLFRVFSLMNEYSNYSVLTKEKDRRVEFSTNIKKIRNLDLNTGYEYADRDEVAVELRKKEVFLEGRIINGFHQPISNGDIFEIGSKEYILLIQPCNVALRSDGKRGYDFNKGHLIPIKQKKISNNISFEELKSIDSSETQKYGVNFPEFKFIELNILDLAVYDVEGECRINMNEVECENELIHNPWKVRYKKLFKIYDKYEKSISAFNRLISAGNNIERGDIQLLRPYLKKPNCLKDFPIGSEGIYDESNRVFNFRIKRIKKYRAPYSIDLLQKFMNYLSRNAFDHDFSE